VKKRAGEQGNGQDDYPTSTIADVCGFHRYSHFYQAPEGYGVGAAVPDAVSDSYALGICLWAMTTRSDMPATPVDAAAEEQLRLGHVCLLPHKLPLLSCSLGAGVSPVLLHQQIVILDATSQPVPRSTECLELCSLVCVSVSSRVTVM
jgi:hypothetical protein